MSHRLDRRARSTIARRSIRLVWEILRALGPMMLIEVSLRTADLPTTCRRLRVACDLASATPPAPRRAVLPRNTRAAMLASRVLVSHWPGGDSCLRQCLLAGRRLRHLGPVLRIGVKRDAGGAFSAHAWLEIGGRSIDPAASQFAALGAAGR